MVATVPPPTNLEPPADGEAPRCPRVDCYICHPDIPLPWWAFQSRRFLVWNKVTVAQTWFDRAIADSTEDKWRLLGNAEKAIREAAQLMQPHEE